MNSLLDIDELYKEIINILLSGYYIKKRKLEKEGKNIKDFLKEKNLCYQTLLRLMHGSTKNPRLDTLIKYLDAFECHIVIDHPLMEGHKIILKP